MTSDGESGGLMTGKGGDVKIVKQTKVPKGTKPGVLQICAGLAARGGVGGDIAFIGGDGNEAFRIKPDGTVIIRGERYTQDKVLYQAMREFFAGPKKKQP
jgi:hypothetical protein